MNERVVSLSDRGRALEWLSLGFGLWLIASLVGALVLGEAKASTARDLAWTIEPTRALVLASSVGQLVAVAALGLGLAILFRSCQRLWFGCALAPLVVLLVDNLVVIARSWFGFGESTLDWSGMYGLGAAAEMCLVALAILGVRALAHEEEEPIPVFVLGAAIGASVFHFLLVATFPFDEEMLRRSKMLPSIHAALVAIASLASVGLVLIAIRATSRVVRSQIWAGELGVTTPARAGDWQRTAAGLDRAGAFLIGKIAIAAAATPLLLIGLLTGSEALLARFVVPFASAVFSAGMVTGLLACRRVPDPPDARAGFTGAALLIAACLAGELYALSARAGEPLAEAVSALGHLVAYLALLRSIGRIGERLGDDDVTRRARVLAFIAVPAVGGGTIAGYLLIHHVDDLGIAIATPIVVAALAFAALLPAALLARQLASRLRERFAEPPRAVARVS